MRILSWQGRICDCRPQCDAERADAAICCTGCGAEQAIGYADEGSLVALEEWFGPDGSWHVQVWPQMNGPPELSIIEPPQGFDAERQWLAEIADLLDKDAYEFPSPKDLA